MNPLTAMHIAIFGLALWSLLLGGREALAGTQDLVERLNRRTAAGLLIAVGPLFGLLWFGQIGATSLTGVLPPDLVTAGLSANPVYALDLAFFLPLCALAGIGLLRRTDAATFAFPMLIWVPLMGAGIVGGFILMAVAGDLARVPVVVTMTGLGVVSSILAAAALVRPRSSARLVETSGPGATSLARSAKNA